MFNTRQSDFRKQFCSLMSHEAAVKRSVRNLSELVLLDNTSHVVATVVSTAAIEVMLKQNTLYISSYFQFAARQKQC